MTDTFDLSSAKETMLRCRNLREEGRVEAVLRAEFHSRLRVVFPADEDERWINHYGEGTEALTRIGSADERVRNRFIENLVGATTIEYESDLRIDAKRETGLGQVREHAAGLLRAGIPATEIRGILSDTVEWRAFSVELDDGTDPARCEPASVLLTEIERFDASDASDANARHFVGFLRKHLAREQSRPLLASNIVIDIGLESGLYARCAPRFEELVSRGRETDTSIALSTHLWSTFVDHFERHGGEFRLQAYVDEVYVGIIAKLLSANVLRSQAMLSEHDELKAILTGAYFSGQYQLKNMVEQDYFGWLTGTAHIETLLPIAQEIQRDLYAYDFALRFDEDLFGRLMAQLARRSERRLLGQEWTPQWLAKLLADNCLGRLPEGELPRVIDMCCGSGAILAEVLKEARNRFPDISFAQLTESATGFDIDPLAVTLAKTTWVVTLAEEIRAARSPVVIPIYHADSLFAVTPVSWHTPLDHDADCIEIELDDEKLEIPATLVQPQYLDFFDHIVDWAYDTACAARGNGGRDIVSETDAERFVDGTASSLSIELAATFREHLAKAAFALARRMSTLALANRNGIWAFILRNTYRPGLLAGQFNGLVSNPPWLAMSRLAENPYRDQLRTRSALYDLIPSGSSHLHLELAATYLIHAVDRYLADGAAVACLVPGTVFNATHFEKFRQQTYLRGRRPVALEVQQAWRIAQGTFKYPGAAIIGMRRTCVADVDLAPPAGFAASPPDRLTPAELSLLPLGASRTAWALEHDSSTLGTQSEENLPQQGADLMPRPAVCVDILDTSGAEYRVATPGQDSASWFSVKDSKKLRGANFPGHVAPQFLYRMAQSVNLLPFTFGENFASIALPAERDEEGAWILYTEKELRDRGFIQTARRFQRINDVLTGEGNGKSLQLRINERNKLSRQVFLGGNHLVLAGAGGQYVCAACLPLAGNEDIIIDQTLYWTIAGEDDARYQVAILNSIAMTEAVRPFNPKGDFGERHIHTLPYRLLPPFDPSNEAHLALGELAQELAVESRNMLQGDERTFDPAKPLARRRSRIRNALIRLPSFRSLEEYSADLLGTTAFGGEPPGEA